MLPELYSGSAYVVINDNQPNFSAAELTTNAYEKYAALDSNGRCGTAIASCGTEIMPGESEERTSISNIYPSGWKQAKYSGISGGYLWNRCHLIGWQLSAENANEKNLITGTRYMNTEGMLPFENMVADYIQETGNHVAYRVTPVFEKNNLVCSGVQMEAYSVEDNGEGICFNVYCYNVQPGITIDYATGKSVGKSSESPSKTENTESKLQNQTPVEDMVWIPKTGSKYHSNPNCSNMKNPTQITIEEAENRGYEPCKKCY
ncbi:DNA/RNA non-specific endonuclease [Phocea massiliensis]|uniref:DNA/RNA non-specific endonuclease n=1 Tax=Merdimmobilis hominis TaxID=2897707 RepID=A0A938X8I3_9FIRM|nr:DNA/RNA non-specific endonuclease [Merdimmobilis hominis]